MMYNRCSKTFATAFLLVLFVVAPNSGIRATLNVLNKTCFVAGTPILTPNGAKRIEEFRAGDQILSRAEDQPKTPVRTSVVEEVFELAAPILELRLGGQTIETTAEHPFYVAEKGWVRAEKLESGDRLVGHNDRLTPVDSITITDRHQTVYNVRVAEDHTYFVGDDDWGFSVWVHNAYSVRKAADGTWEILDNAGAVIRHGLDEDYARFLAEGWTELASGAVPRITTDIAAKITNFSRKSLRDQRTVYNTLHDTYLDHLRKYGQIAGQTEGEVLRMERELRIMRSILEGRGRTFGSLGNLLD